MISGYVEAGYAIVLGSLAAYSVSLVTRERASRRRRAPERPARDLSPGPDMTRPGTTTGDDR